MIVFKIVWVSIILMFFAVAQVLFEKDRFLWFGLFSPVIEGEARVMIVSKERKRHNLYTIHLMGINGTPDFSMVNEPDSMNYYKLEKIYNMLKLMKKEEIINVSWKKPWRNEPIYVAVKGDGNIVGSGDDFIWLIFSIIPCVFIFVAFRYDIFNKDRMSQEE